MRIIQKLARDQRAATVIEYGLIVGMIFLAIVGSVNFVAGRAINTLNDVSANVANVTR